MSILSLDTGTIAHFIAEGSDVQGQIDLDRLQDVTVTNVQNGQVLKYDTAQSLWINTATGSITSLEDLSDVTITTISNGQVIAWNSTTSSWENTDVIATLVDGGTY